MRIAVVALILLSISITVVFAGKKHDDNEQLTLWVNKVGPYFNPQETYLYHKLPFCSFKENKQEKAEGLGEALLGYELRNSGYDIKYKVDVASKELCTKELSKSDAMKFRKAIQSQYWYEFFLDDLPIWGMVGDINDKDEEYPYIYTHQRFTIKYNGDRIIEAKLTPEILKPVVEGAKLTFSYSVQWFPSDQPYQRRFDRYLDNSFFEHQIHWFSIFNSFMMVVFLVGLVSMILMRTLRKDFATFGNDEEDEGIDIGVDGECGWKQVRGDVFRAPPHLGLFSALYGTGIQIAALIFFVVALAIGFYHSHFIYARGSMVSAFIGCYAVTSFISGYISGSHYHQHAGKQAKWIQTMVLTAILFPCTCFCLAFVLDIIAMSYASLASIPLTTMFIVFAIWIFFAVPLTGVGTIVGRNWAGKARNPCRVSPVPRPIPEKQWYQEPWAHIVLAGILPFGSIFIEMYFVFTAFWQYKYYYVFGFLLLVFFILVIVTVCVDIVSIYFLLNSEDYRWHWVSFLGAASTSGYVYLYGLYYFMMKTRMTGLMQTSFYFGYLLMFCLGMGIMCGAIGYMGTAIFVHRIFNYKMI